MASLGQWFRQSRVRIGLARLLSGNRYLSRYRWVYAVVFVFAAMSATARFTSQPAFCVTCHEMSPEYATWEASAHSKVSCQACHTEARPANLQHKIQALGQVYLHVSGRVPDNIEIKVPIGNQVCETCHNRQRQVTVAGDLNIPHARHIEIQGMSCVDCHASTAHASVTKRFQRVAHAPADLVRQLSTSPPERYRPEMAACIACHIQTKAPTQCDACHREIKTPTNHLTLTWQTEHGPQAMSEYAQCLYCHDIALGKPVTATRQDREEAIRGNSFCSSCHLQRPPSHNADWQLGHRHPAKLSKDRCLVCHDQSRSSERAASAVPACQDCHSQNHGAGWRQAHGAEVKRSGMKTCFTCHEARNCGSCHEANQAGRV